jgi:DNA-binding LytR/AlgR family response regulator
MSTRIFVVEDELLHLEAIQITLEEGRLDLAGTCGDADKAFELIQKAKPDVVLVDIALPGINNGITLAERINRELSIPHIFTTSFTDDKVIEQAVATNPSGYLRKPVELVNLKAAIKIALQKKQLPEEVNFTAGNYNLVFVKVGDKLVRVDLQEVLMVKADGENCISLVTEKKEFISRTTLKEFCSELPPEFIQTHRSCFINLKQLDSFNEREQFAILKGKIAPVARSFRKDFLNALHKI